MFGPGFKTGREAAIRCEGEESCRLGESRHSSGDIRDPGLRLEFAEYAQLRG